MATRHVLADLVAAAAEAGLGSVEVESLGGVDAARRVREGEAFDLVFLADDALAALAAEGHVAANTVAPLVVSSVAVAVRAAAADAAARPSSSAGGAASADVDARTSDEARPSGAASADADARKFGADRSPGAAFADADARVFEAARSRGTAFADADARVSDAARPSGVAFADASGLRAALVSASAIGYSTGPSGTALVRQIADWGLSDEVGPKLVQARPGIPVAKLVADGEVDLGLQQLSELVGAPGIRILGTLPADCAITTVFSGAVATNSSDAAAARRLLDFLSSPAAAAIKERHSFEVPAAPAP